MGIPTWNVGQVLAASDVNNWFVPLAAFKATNQSISSTTTLTNDTALFVTVAANASYYVQCYLSYEGFTQGAGDLKWQFTGPAGATASLTAVYYPTSGGVGANVNLLTVTAIATPRAAGTNGSGNVLAMVVTGFLNTSGTSGTFQLQWCQNTSSTTPTIIHSQSALIAHRIG